MAISNAEREALKRELLAEIEAERAAEEARIAAAKAKAEMDARREFLLLEEARRNVMAEMARHEEPYIALKGVVEDPEYGMKLELDWNDSFVRHLRASGIEGPTDDIMVQRWLEIIAREVGADIMAREAEHSMFGEQSEFE
jgi:hypothetical protein